jgi:hypothetical protein
VDCHKAGGSRVTNYPSARCHKPQNINRFQQSWKKKKENLKPRTAFATLFILLFHDTGTTAKHLQVSFTYP